MKNANLDEDHFSSQGKPDENRLELVISRFSSRSEAAKVAGVTLEQLNKWVKGKARAPFTALANMANATDVSLDWLATGKGQILRMASADLTRPGLTPVETPAALSLLAETLVDHALYSKLFEQLERLYEEDIALGIMTTREVASLAYEKAIAIATAHSNREDRRMAALDAIDDERDQINARRARRRGNERQTA